MAEGAPTPAARRRIPLVVLLTPLVVATVVASAADVFGPALITERPLLQIALNPRNRYLVLAAAQVAAVPFLVVAFVRLALADPVAYVLGRQYGDGALRWLERKMGDDGTIRTLERWFARAGHAVVLIAPNLYVCLLAGTTGMRPRTFVLLDGLGTLGRLLLFLAFAESAGGFLDGLLELIQRYQWWLVGISFLVVALQTRRRARQGALESPATMEEEILEAEREAATDERGDER